MLTKEEKLRLAACIDVLKHDIEVDPDKGNGYQEPGLDLVTQLWLAEKLQEVSDQYNNLLGDFKDLQLRYDQLNGTA